MRLGQEGTDGILYGIAECVAPRGILHDRPVRRNQLQSGIARDGYGKYRSIMVTMGATSIPAQAALRASAPIRRPSCSVFHLGRGCVAGGRACCSGPGRDIVEGRGAGVGGVQAGDSVSFAVILDSTMLHIS